MKYSTRFQPKPTGNTFQTILSLLAHKTNYIPKVYGSGYKSLCPAHPDRNPSLGISEADDGKVLMCCFAGCRIQDICKALDIPISALFPRKKRGYHG